MVGSGDKRIRCDSVNVNYAQVSDLIHAPTATWRLDILNALFDEEQVATICAIPLSKSGKCDEIIWRLDGLGAYSVKNGYRLLRDDLLTAANVTAPAYSNLVVRFFNEMWLATLPVKVKINMWRIANKFVPTYSILHNRRLNVNNDCPLCLSSSESIAHLMRDCSFGVIDRDSAGLIMASCIVPHYHVTDAFVAEVVACFQAITLAKELGFRRVVIEGDSLMVIKNVCSLTSDGSMISPIIYDIRDVVREFVSISFRFIHRTGNNDAHSLARVGRRQRVPSYFVEEAPSEAIAAAMLDLEKLVHLR
ncbi:hypothetical protein V6N11_028783 [Hibiscus sabdariffa]|uniref:RNase H type-1 domain-containing protein n=1 Tax=Hibiscus sabdariffa TaxID=183260 RepID=A0ABR2PQW5_9ROSI